MVTITVDPQKRFHNAITKATKELDDLRVPLSLISRSWFKGNKAIFSLAGEGKYEKLSGKYRKWKIAKLGGIKILRRSGSLEKSLTSPSDAYSVNNIANNKVLTVGTKVLSPSGRPYAIYLQNGTKFMPARPPVLIGPEQVAPASMRKQMDNWARILEQYVLQKSKQFGDVK